MLCWEEKKSKGNANNLSRFGVKRLGVFAPHRSHMLQFTTKTLKSVSVVVAQMSTEVRA